MGTRLEGKVALVTGGARGMGEAEARRFCAEGAKVVIADVLDDIGQTVAADLGADAAYVHLDVSSEDDWATAVAATVERFGAPTVLVNNAGIARYETIDRMPKEEVVAHLSVNVVGPWLGIKSVFEPMRRAGGGSIINIGSTNSVRGAAGATAYATSKHAVAGLTKSAAVELGPFGIRVNMVLPGGVATPMIADAAPWFGPAPLDNSPTEWSLPLKRWGMPEDIAAMVLFLASDESAYSTGAEFVVDGGMTADHPFKPAAAWVEHREALLAESRD
ncbi:glucose 1-dehydrogenase (plasmid) [Nocardioides sp. R1-1]|uniref:glucose 1-dehydrogenase n=1 Tax=Nocardioides sp. R1-1 TaxID=3383502 RepID=UPI0038D13424